jgi:hypothetical protein
MYLGTRYIAPQQACARAKWWHIVSGLCVCEECPGGSCFTHIPTQPTLVSAENNAIQAGPIRQP